MTRKFFYDLAHVCTLVLVPGVAAWVLGQPLIFPSLGPSAFALVLDENENRVRRVVGGHLIGVLSGLLAYHVLAHGLTLAALSPPLSADGLRIVASGVVSIALTVAAMSAARANHAPPARRPSSSRLACCRVCGRGADHGRRDRHVPDAPPGDAGAEMTAEAEGEEEDASLAFLVLLTSPLGQDTLNATVFSRQVGEGRSNNEG